MLNGFLRRCGFVPVTELVSVAGEVERLDRQLRRTVVERDDAREEMLNERRCRLSDDVAKDRVVEFLLSVVSGLQLQLKEMEKHNA